MDYRFIKNIPISLLIITSLVAFNIGLSTSNTSYTRQAVDYNAEPSLSDLSPPQVDSPTVSNLEYQHIKKNEHSVPPQFVVDIVDTTIESMLNYPILNFQDFQYQQSSEPDGKVLVAILDTGIDADHEALCSVVASEINFSDSPEGATDIHGHGTHIAGIIAASPDNDLGLQGVASNCRLLNVKVVDDRGHYKVSDLVEGILWAVDNGANVINLSLVTEKESTELEMAIEYAWQRGVVVVAAAGNGGTDTPVYPAVYEHCIAVTAADDDGNLIPLANYGDWVDVAAPGYKIYSTLPGDAYGYMYGTSFATAYVSGIAAVLFPLVPDSNGDGKVNDEVRQLLLNEYPDDSIYLVRN